MFRRCSAAAMRVEEKKGSVSSEGALRGTAKIPALSWLIWVMANREPFVSVMWTKWMALNEDSCGAMQQRRAR